MKSNLCVLLTLLLTTWVAAAQKKPATNPSGPTTPQEGKLKPGDAAPDFTLKLLDDKEGRTVTLSKLQGQKPVVLIFGSFT